MGSQGDVGPDSSGISDASVCIYTYMHTYIHTYICAYTYTYTEVYIGVAPASPRAQSRFKIFDCLDDEGTS